MLGLKRKMEKRKESGYTAVHFLISGRSYEVEAIVNHEWRKKKKV